MHIAMQEVWLHMKLAIPTDGKAGLDSTRSGHFGHCDAFTIVEIDGDDIIECGSVANNHDEGGCLAPVALLSQMGVDAIVAAGMGMRPLMGFADAGITVYYEAETPGVGDVARLIASGSVPVMTADNACQHHHQ